MSTHTDCSKACQTRSSCCRIQSIVCVSCTWLGETILHFRKAETIAIKLHKPIICGQEQLISLLHLHWSVNRQQIHSINQNRVLKFVVRIDRICGPAVLLPAVWGTGIFHSSMVSQSHRAVMWLRCVHQCHQRTFAMFRGFRWWRVPIHICTASEQARASYCEIYIIPVA